jgi:group II intron reverse transcriptase/maturase
MQKADVLLDIYRKRGAERRPLERVYRHLFDPELYLRAYGKIYRNAGAMTKGTTEETVDGMDLKTIHKIIALLKMERYEWKPARRVMIPKANGKMRPLGIPSFRDKLVQEAVRSLLEPYYEQMFSNLSHGFRPNRGCHSALSEIRHHWTGTTWFIEGDIKGCFDNIDHEVLLSIIRRNIDDGRLVELIRKMLKAGYLEDWKYFNTFSGTPQGGIISPLLANIYLNELDGFVEGTLIPAYTRGDRRRPNPEYRRFFRLIDEARRRNDLELVKQLKQERRRYISVAPVDPDYRRLKYVRYADDFLLGFVGPKDEAEEIRQRLGEFLGNNLKLTMSPEKTLITHAADDKAKFLGYEITVSRSKERLTEGRRSANGRIALLMPQRVVQKYHAMYSKGGKISHKGVLTAESDYTIVQRYQSVLRGIYNFYCMATNVGNRRRMSRIKWILEVSLTKTLACKFKCKVTDIYKRYRATVLDNKALQVVVRRPDKDPLVATFGGFPFERVPEGIGVVDFQHQAAWHKPFTKRAEVVQRLLAGKCELCGAKGVPLQAHHIRKLADIDRPGRRPKTYWERLMSVMKRKSLVVCEDCHTTIHGGRYDGPAL